MAKKYYILTEEEIAEYNRLVKSGETMTYSIYATIPHIVKRSDYFRFINSWSEISIVYSEIESEIFPNL